MPGRTAGPVTGLFQAHVTVLVRLAVLLLGDEAAAEDVVRNALFGLRGRWSAPHEQDYVVACARSSVLNGCRDVLDRRFRDGPAAPVERTAKQASVRGPAGQEHREVLAALHRLPGRQREAVVFRHCLGLSEDETAQAMGVSRDTVRLASHYGLAALARSR